MGEGSRRKKSISSCWFTTGGNSYLTDQKRGRAICREEIVGKGGRARMEENLGGLEEKGATFHGGQ